MPPLRILVADPSDTVRAVVTHAVADQPDLVPIETRYLDVEVMLSAEEADVVVVGMVDGRLPALAERLVDVYTDLGVVAIDLDRGRGVILQLRPQLTEITDLSPPTLGAAIRKAATRFTPLS